MLKLITKGSHTVAIAALLGGIALVNPAHAQPATPDAPPPAMAATAQAEPAPAMSMKDRVEDRIKTLHDKLMVNPEQESAWKKVADAMRDNEAKAHELVEKRHENAAAMNAVDDLKSYQKIAEEHAEGLKKFNGVFEKFYGGLSADQKANADRVFGSYEGVDRKGK